MKPLFLVILLLSAGIASAQPSVTFADLEKYMKKFNDTTAIIKALQQKKFISERGSEDYKDWFAYYFTKKIAGRITYSELITLEKDTEVLLQYTNYLNQGLQECKDQILKAGYNFSGKPIDRGDYKVYVYTRRFTEMSDIEIQLQEEKDKYVITFHFRQLELKAIEQ